MNKDEEISTDLALESLSATRLNLNDPFLWASGYRMPIYRDNREFLGSYESRMRIVDAFIGMTSSKIDCIAGTSLAGIPHAVGLSHMLGIPAIIFENGKPYEIASREYPNAIIVGSEQVVAQSPWCVGLGIRVANDHEVGFAYIRPTEKTHGLGKMIEGKFSPRDQVMGIFLSNQDVEAKTIISKHGLELKNFILLEIESIRHEYDLKGKNVLVIEDSVSRGGSSYAEVELVRSCGGTCHELFTIFDYGFPESKKLFEEAGCKVKSLFSYDDLMRVAREKGSFSKSEFEVLDEWRKDPWNWGEKRGFPRIPKS